jgi:DNA-binding MarR family transcriptional regulator
VDENREITYKLHKVIFLMDKLTDKALQAKHKIRFSQFRMLMAISRHKELCQKEIAQYWEMTEAAVSRQVDILIESKLISREESKENRSKNVLSLTKKGSVLLTSVFKTISQLHGKIYQELDQNEKKIINQGLEKLFKKLCQKN